MNQVRAFGGEGGGRGGGNYVLGVPFKYAAVRRKAVDMLPKMPHCCQNIDARRRV